MIESYGIPKKQNMFGCETFQREQKQSTKSGTYVYIMALEASYIQIHAQYEVNVLKKKFLFLTLFVFCFYNFGRNGTVNEICTGYMFWDMINII